MAATTTTRSGPVVAVLDRPKEATHSHKIWTEPPGLDTTNPRGDVEALTNPDTGTTTATYRYTAYGAPDPSGTTGEDKPPTSPTVDDVLNPYRYNAKRMDPATGKYDMGFRNYDPGLNTFLTRDMYNGALADMRLGLDPWNTNRYAYAGGNPLTRIELDGHVTTTGDGGGKPTPKNNPPPPPTPEEEAAVWEDIYRSADLDPESTQDLIEHDRALAEEPQQQDEFRSLTLAFINYRPDDRCVDHAWCAWIANPDIQETIALGAIPVERIGAFTYKAVMARRAATITERTAANGGLRVVGGGFSASERYAAETLASQGRNVVLREADSAAGRTSDLLVDNVPYDVYTPRTGNLDRIVSSIASKGSQVRGGGVVLDLSKSPLRPEQVGNILPRVQGVTDQISDIIVLGGPY